MARPKSRTQPCNRGDALNRLAQAESLVEVAELVAADDTGGVDEPLQRGQEQVAAAFEAGDLGLASGRTDGRLHGMRTTIDRAGRLVVPKKLRDRLALGHGGEVDVFERDGVLEIHPLPASVEVRSGGGGPVAHAIEALPPLTDDDVRGTLEHLRR